MEETPFGRYRLLSILGEGGMGTVFKAHDTVFGRDVAIKVLPPEMAADRGYQERFRREAFAATRLAEPHIIPIFDRGEIDGRLYLVMPIIDGVDLHTLLQREGPMTPQLAVQIIEQLADALAAAHAIGLVHRDIKPSNALVTPNGFVYLIDFGIAHDVSATKLTKTGMLVGTLAYMAPERFNTDSADSRADVYALTCVLHECLTGRQPFPGASLERQIAGHLTMEPPRPSVQRPGVPAVFDGVIARGMAKDPAQRYQHVRELAMAARAAVPAPISHTPPPVLYANVFPGAIPQAEPKGGWWRTRASHWSAALMLAVPALICIAAMVFAGMTGRLYLADRSVADVKRAIVQTATEALTTMWSYTPDNIDTLAARTGTFLDGSFRDQYIKFVNSIAAPNKQAQITNVAQVVGAGVETLEGSDASVLVYVNNTSSSPLTNNVPSLRYLSYRADMRQKDSRWLISKLATVTSLDLKPSAVPK